MIALCAVLALCLCISCGVLALLWSDLRKKMPGKDHDDSADDRVLLVYTFVGSRKLHLKSNCGGGLHAKEHKLPLALLDGGFVEAVEWCKSCLKSKTCAAHLRKMLDPSMQT